MRSPGARIAAALVGVTAAAAAAAVAGACGVDVVGGPAAPAGTGPAGAAAADAPPPGTNPPDPRCSASQACARGANGWSLVAVVAARGAGDAGFVAPSCPAGWGNPKVGIEEPRPTAETCACACGAPLGNPCLHDTVPVKHSDSGGCSNGPVTLDATGTCKIIAGTGLPLSVERANGPLPTAVPVACAATASLPPLADRGAYAVCEPAADATACKDGRCVERADVTAFCLRRPGVHACPLAGYTRHVLTAPEAIVDRRSCGACTCTTAATTCSSAVLELYTDSACSVGKREVGLDGACNNITAGALPSHYRVQAQPAALTCAAASPTAPVDGAVATDPFTLCCP